MVVPGKAAIVLIVIIIATVGAFALWWFGPLSVTVLYPTRGAAIDAVYATGIVEPSVMLPIAPRAAGHLKALHVDEGATVHKGEVLAQLDAADLENTVAELAAQERYAREQYRRTEEIVQRRLAAAAELDRTRSNWEAANAALKRARAQRDFMTLKAPADGWIIRRDGEIGQFITVGQALFYLSTSAPLRVTADVDEEDIPRVHVGQPAVLRADALPGRVFDGEVSEVTPKGDPVARSYRVRLRLADPGELKVGMTVDTNLIVAKREDALLVPTTAVQNDAVWVVRDGRLHRQPIKSGTVGEQRIEVLQGLGADAAVVSTPTDSMREGRRVWLRQTWPEGSVGTQQ